MNGFATKVKKVVTLGAASFKLCESSINRVCYDKTRMSFYVDLDTNFHFK